MLAENKAQLEIGNWIKGRSQNGELLVGYIEALNSSREVADVTVVNSDNNDIVGETIKMFHEWIEVLPATFEKNEKQLRALIDLALVTRDEAWFKELSTKIKSVRKKQKELIS